MRPFANCQIASSATLQDNACGSPFQGSGQCYRSASLACDCSLYNPVRLHEIKRRSKTYQKLQTCTKAIFSNVFLACLVSHQISCFMPSYCYASQAGIDAGPDPCCMRRGKWVDVALIVSFVPSLGSEDIYSSCRCLKFGEELKGGGVYFQPK